MITQFHPETPEPVRDILQAACHNRDSRLRLFYGDQATGRDWLEENFTIGYIGNSTGPSKIPLLIHNARSMVGDAILDNCIVKIVNTRTHRILWQHPRYNRPNLAIIYPDSDAPSDLPAVVYSEGEPRARFATQDAARRYVEFMRGERMNK